MDFRYTKKQVIVFVSIAISGALLGAFSMLLLFQIGENLFHSFLVANTRSQSALSSKTTVTITNQAGQSPQVSSTQQSAQATTGNTSSDISSAGNDLNNTNVDSLLSGLSQNDSDASSF